MSQVRHLPPRGKPGSRSAAAGPIRRTTASPKGATAKSGSAAGGTTKGGGPKSAAGRPLAARPALHLLPTAQISPEEAAVDAAVDAALGSDFSRTVSALRRPITTLAKESGTQVGEVSADDAEAWWVNVAVPVLNEVAKRVVLTQAGQSPSSVVDGALLEVIGWLLAQHEDAEMAQGALPPSHPARLKRLVLIVAASSEPIAIRDHALAMALVFSGASARVVSGPITRTKLAEVVRLVQPAVVVLPRCPHSLRCPEATRCPERLQMAAIAELHPDIPVVEAPAARLGGKGFTALVDRVLSKINIG